MANRFWNAWCIAQGACNPSGIAHSIIDACKEMRNEGAGTAAMQQDAAVRIMVHQLTSICGAQYNSSLSYGEDLNTCREKADAELPK